MCSPRTHTLWSALCCSRGWMEHQLLCRGSYLEDAHNAHESTHGNNNNRQKARASEAATPRSLRFNQDVSGFVRDDYSRDRIKCELT